MNHRIGARGGQLGDCLRCLLLVGVLLVGAGAALAPGAQADGDPGSDVLVNQSVFLPPDADVGVAQQTQLDALLSRAKRAGFPVRVAVIAAPDDLGALTPLWLRPQSYARFLEAELSLVFKGPLLVVMPNGLGFQWPGHAAAAAERRLEGITVAPGDSGLIAATTTAVKQLATVDGARLSGASAAAQAGATASSGRAAAPSGGAASGAQGGPTIVSSGGGATSAIVIVAILAALIAIVLATWLIARRSIHLVTRRRLTTSESAGSGSSAGGWRASLWTVPGLAVVAAAGLVVLLTVSAPASSSRPVSDLANSPTLDPGSPLPESPAPNFVLYDQFGKRVTLRQYRGKVVLLAFIDAECTTICPLTTTAMLDAKRLLGATGKQVQLLGVDSDPKATQVEDVLSYSQLHGLTSAWRFGTGTLGQLAAVWKHYYVETDIQDGLISHTAALFVIDPQGRERKLYTTQQAYTAVPQLGQLLAQEASRLLPSHPAVASHLSYGQVPTVSPTVAAQLPRSGGGTVRIGPGADRLYAFFDTWGQEVMPLSGDLDALNDYAAAAVQHGLPKLIGVDEGSVEPSVSALPRFLRGLSAPLQYPVAIDNTGRVADGYEVQGEPWLMLTSSTGKVLWYDEPDTSGWPKTGRLEAEVRQALTQGPVAPTSESAAQKELAGSPAPLAALHQRASQLVGGGSALAAEIKTLRGYPIVVNIWASSCAPCQAEFNLFADASARYGRSVAFLGADYNDSSADARAFLRQHSVSYPSYSVSAGQLGELLPGGIQGTPTTVYITPTGHVYSIHTGQYESQGGLDGDIQTYAPTAPG